MHQSSTSTYVPNFIQIGRKIFLKVTTEVLVKFRVTWHKNRTNIKNPAWSILILCSSLRISGHLPAPIVNGGGDRFWKWKEFKLSRARDLDRESGHTAYRRASLIDLYLYTKFHWNRRNFLWTDGRTDGRTFPPSNIIRSTIGSRPKNRSWSCTLRSWSCRSGVVLWSTILSRSSS